jgi:hypothetical protein
MPTKLKPLPPATLPQDSGPSQAVEPDSRTAFPFKGGETAALGKAETVSFLHFHSSVPVHLAEIPAVGRIIWIE